MTEMIIITNFLLTFVILGIISNMKKKQNFFLRCELKLKADKISFKIIKIRNLCVRICECVLSGLMLISIQSISSRLVAKPKVKSTLWPTIYS